MKRTSLRLLSWLPAALGLLGGATTAPHAWAQQTLTEAAAPAKPAGVTIDLKNGQQAVASKLRIDGSTLLATEAVDQGTGEIGYPLAGIEKVEFPNPPPLASAKELLAQDKDAEALAAIDPIVTYYAPFKAVPGNWWLPSALVRYDALAALRREREIDALLSEMATAPNNPSAVEAARVRTAETLVRRGTPDRAEPILDELLKTSPDDDALARIWTAKGQVLLADKAFEPALLACLHVPVFYPDNRQEMPPALLGSGRAFLGIDKPDDARTTLQQLITNYPTSHAAIEAKAELDRLNRKKKPARAGS